jgi:nucleoid DNA-binding protein
MDVEELIAKIQQKNAKLLDGIPQDKAKALVTGVFRHIRSTLTGTEEGKVDYAGLGRFRIKQVEKDKKGKKVTRSRISFRPIGPGEGKDAGKGKRKAAGDHEES